MNRNLQLSHLCNVDDLYFRLVSAAVYETKQHSSSINPLIFQAIIKEILDEFLRNFSISLSHFLHISSHPIFSSYPSFLAELVDYLPVADHKKIFFLKKLILQGAGIRAFSYYSFYIKFRSYSVENNSLFADPFRVSSLNILPSQIFPPTYDTISISPYNFMSFGHYAWPIMAINLLLSERIDNVILWAVSNHTSDSGALLDILTASRGLSVLHLDPTQTDLFDPAWSDAYQTSHFFHMKHNNSNLLNYQNYPNHIRSRITETHYSSVPLPSTNTIIFHCRDHSYKSDSESSEASTRNTNSKNIFSSLKELYPHSNIIDWNQFLSSPQSHTKYLQWYQLCSADLIVASMSGLSLMCQLTSKPVVFHNSTNFSLGYDIPSSHLFIPKRLSRRSDSYSLPTLHKSKLLSWLLGDWSFNPIFTRYFELVELTSDQLTRDLNQFNTHNSTDIIPWFYSKCTDLGIVIQDITPQHPSRFVTMETLVMFNSLLEEC